MLPERKSVKDLMIELISESMVGVDRKEDSGNWRDALKFKNCKNKKFECPVKSLIE